MDQVQGAGHYGYNADEDLTSVAAAGSDAGPSTSYSYTVLNQLATYTTGGSTRSFGYDAAGSPTALADGSVVTFDRAQEPLTLTAADGGVTRFDMDARGNITRASGSETTANQLAYDAANRLTRYSRGETTATYAYNGDGQRTAKVVNGTTTLFAWDNVTGSSPLMLSDGTHEFIYGPGDLALEQTGSGSGPIHLVDSVNVLDDSPGKAGSLTVTFGHQPLPGDQLLLIVNCSSDQTPTTPIGYSEVKTLRSGKPGEISAVYRRSATGEESGASVSFATGTPPHPKSLTAVIYRGVDPSQPIDGVSSAISAGKRASLTVPSVTTTSDRDQLVLIENAMDGVADATWSDAKGMTTRSSVGDARASSVVADQALGAPGPTGTKTIEFSHQAQLEAVLIGLRGGVGTLFLQHDRQGSTTILTDSGGNVAGTYRFDPYGQTATHVGDASTPLRHTGEYQDDESGYYYLQARYYDPSMAQFLTRDPIEEVTGSAYGYAGNAPLDGADPLGLAYKYDSQRVNKSARIAFNFLRNAGFSARGAAALVGNFMYESASCDPDVPDGVAPRCGIGQSYGRGIAQWDTRWDAYTGANPEYLSLGWDPPSKEDRWTLLPQLKFVVFELKHVRLYENVGHDLIKGTASVDDLTFEVFRLYEKPQEWGENSDESEAWLDQHTSLRARKIDAARILDRCAY